MSKREEIEITPEMIEAGAEQLASSSHGWESLEDGVIRIFYATCKASPKMAEMMNAQELISLNEAARRGIERVRKPM